MLQQNEVQLIKMREFHADVDTSHEIKVYVNGVEMADCVTDMYAADEPNVEVDGWAECWMLDPNGKPIHGYDNDEVWFASYTLHGRIRWEYMNAQK